MGCEDWSDLGYFVLRLAGINRDDYMDVMVRWEFDYDTSAPCPIYDLDGTDEKKWGHVVYLTMYKYELGYRHPVESVYISGQRVLAKVVTEEEWETLI